MADAIHPDGLAADRDPVARWQLGLANLMRSAGRPLLFGVRLWVSVCLALYVAFWLQLDNAYWAGTTAALVCQPHLGASLRKGWFRMIGSVAGAVAIVVLTAWFPQNPFGFLVGLALWGGACALVATLLHNFAAYAAALAGYTAAIIASDQLGAIGGPNGQAFTFAITRVSEIWIGIVCAGVVLAGTDFGDAPRRLAVQFAALAGEIANGFSSSLGLAGLASSDAQQPIRRELIRSVIALDPAIDESVGESSRLRYHSPVLQAAFDGLFAALAAWRGVVARLTRLPKDAARKEANAVLLCIPTELRSAMERADAALWMNSPSRMRGFCDAAVRKLITVSAGTPSLRLLADESANVLAAFAAVLNGLALLVADSVRLRSNRHIRLYVPDWLPALINAGRAFVTIGAVEVFWIVTAWPDGALALTWTSIVVILFSLRADEAYARTISFMAGTGLAAVFAAIVLFAVLPNRATFAGFSIVMGLYLVPVGALMAQSSQAMSAVFAPMAGNFVPLLGPANQISYDTVQFYNSALAIIAGSGAAALSFRLLPPLSPAFRAQRLLALTLRDLRRLAKQALQRLADDWEDRIYSRLAVLPDSAEPLKRAQLVTALSVGIQIIRLRRIAPQLGLQSQLDSALAFFAQGNSAGAIAELKRLDRRLANTAASDPQAAVTLRVRSSILLVCDALEHHRAYFDAGAAV